MHKFILLLLSLSLITFSSCTGEPAETEETTGQEAVEQEATTPETATEITEPEPPGTLSTPTEAETTELQTEAAEDEDIDHPIRPGKHSFTLQWISWEEPGTVLVEFLAENQYKVVGRQDGDNGDFARINGVLAYEGNQVFQFDGQLSSRVSYVNGGEVCEKTGPVHFRATGTRKYWRLQEKENCEGGNVVDYFDIYF